MIIDKPFNISVRISDDTEIQELNKKHFDRDYPTDVLSFNMEPPVENGECYLGDIIVNKEQAERQAKEFGNDLEHEIADLVAHGVLHLLGVHHDDDDEHTIHGLRSSK